MGFLGTGATSYADFSLVLEAVIFSSFLIGFRYARRRLTNQHYKTMTAAFAINVVFVASYMIKSLVSKGSATFTGPSSLRTYVYLPTVIVHGTSSLLAFALAGYTLYYGYSRSVEKKRRVFLNAGERGRHRMLGLLTISTWLLAFATGLAVYLLLYILF